MKFDSIRFQPSRPLLKEVSAHRLNTILAEIKKNRPRGERGITVRQSGDATYIGLAAPIGGGTTAAVPQPWDLIARQDPDNENQTLVTVYPGTLSSFLPANWDEEFSCTNTSLYYAKAKITTDGKAITALTIELNTTAPSNQTPQAFGIQTNIDYLFGLVFERSVYRVIGAGHISVNPSVWLTTNADSPPAPGQLPFVNYYQLQ